MGLKPTVGPLFVPGNTACWHCLEARQAELRDVEVMLDRRLGLGGIPKRPVSSVMPLTVQALSMAATQLLRFVILGNNPEIKGGCSAIRSIRNVS